MRKGRKKVKVGKYTCWTKDMRWFGVTNGSIIASSFKQKKVVTRSFLTRISKYYHKQQGC